MRNMKHKNRPPAQEAISHWTTPNTITSVGVISIVMRVIYRTLYIKKYIEKCNKLHNRKRLHFFLFIILLQ